MSTKLKESLNALAPLNSRCTTVAHLPRWVKAALTVHEMHNESYHSCAKPYNKVGGTLANWANTPGGLAWRASLHSIANNPAVMAEMLLRSTLGEAGSDYIWSMEAAKERNDYKEVRLATKDLLGSYGILRPMSEDNAPGAVSINITLGAGETELIAPEVTSSFTIVEAKFEWSEDD